MIEIIDIIEIGIIGVTIVQERYLLIEGDLCQMGFIAAWVRGSRFNVQEGNVVIYIANHRHVNLRFCLPIHNPVKHMMLTGLGSNTDNILIINSIEGSKVVLQKLNKLNFAWGI